MAVKDLGRRAANRPGTKRPRRRVHRRSASKRRSARSSLRCRRRRGTRTVSTLERALRTPTPLYRGDVVGELLRCRAERVVRGPSGPGCRSIRDQRDGALGIGRGEQRGEGEPVLDTEEDRSLGAGRIHHRADVVHPGVKLHAAGLADDVVGESRASTIEQDQSRVSGELAEE